LVEKHKELAAITLSRRNITKPVENQAEPAENTTELAKKCLNWPKSTWIGQNTTKPAEKEHNRPARVKTSSVTKLWTWARLEPGLDSVVLDLAQE
jgi:hypothetical protein